MSSRPASHLVQSLPPVAVLTATHSLLRRRVTMTSASRWARASASTQPVSASLVCDCAIHRRACPALVRSFKDAHACRAMALLPRDSPFHARSLSLLLFFSSDTFTSHVSTVRSKGELAGATHTRYSVCATLHHRRRWERPRWCAPSRLHPFAVTPSARATRSRYTPARRGSHA